MSTQRDPHAVTQPTGADDAPQHEPRVPGATADEQEGRDHPNKPFRTPNKNKTHPAPERGTDGEAGGEKS